MPALFREPVSATTRYCAVLGHPIKHSASPPMQNAAIAALGLNWRYLAFDVAPQHLREAIAGAKALKFIGLNLTVPHKLIALDMVDVVDPSARVWGAVNTIRFEGKDKDGCWRGLAQFEDSDPLQVRACGFNTDADAISQSLREDLGFDLKGARVLLLGAGGAGRVAALKLASDGISKLYLVNRTKSRAVELAAEVLKRFPAVRVEADYPTETVDLLLNATSSGLNVHDPLPIDEGRFSLSRVGSVYDMIYRPAETLLLKAAQAAGVRTANGLGMLLYQGAKALELWSEQAAPIPTMREALKINVYGSTTDKV